MKNMSTVRDILVVEDDQDISYIIKEILVEQGYNVNIASNTSAALEIAAKIKPHLIILDIWLGNKQLDGLGLLKIFKLLYF